MSSMPSMPKKTSPWNYKLLYGHELNQILGKAPVHRYIASNDCLFRTLRVSMRHQMTTLIAKFPLHKSKSIDF